MSFWNRNNQNNTDEAVQTLRDKIDTADAIVIGAGAGLSTAAGFDYSGDRFEKYFSDFAEKYGIRDMYSGGFYPFPDLEEYWGWWSRHIYVNRYMDVTNDTYRNLLKVVENKDYFVITTNVDHQFQRAGFDKKRMYYMQGDYGLWQCVDPCHQKTYDNEETVVKMLLSTGFLKESEGQYTVDLKNRANRKMRIDSALIPICPDCGKPLTMNLRCDDTFVQDEGWYAAKDRYDDFIRRHKDLHVVYMELGTGHNTPVWIKYPFWRMTNTNPNATYVCLNQGEAYAPGEIEERSICIDGDADKVIKDLLAQ